MRPCWRAKNLSPNAMSRMILTQLDIFASCCRELLDALCIASPIAPVVNQTIEPWKVIADVGELQVILIWYFRRYPSQTDIISDALGCPRDGILEIFLCDRAAEKLRLHDDMKLSSKNPV